MEIVCCTVGMLLGDAWAAIPAVRDICAEHSVRLVCGTYALPAWQWAKENIVGCDWEIIRTIDDPDDITCPFCPGIGSLAMDPALALVKSQTPNETVLGYQEIGSYYGYDHLSQESHRHPHRFKLANERRYTPDVKLRRERGASAVTVAQPYTRHDWKNCEMVVARAKYGNPVIGVGLPNETQMPDSWRFCGDFAEICESILRCAGFAGILSSWTNFAAIFAKRQLVASFTDDVPLFFNPNAVILRHPTLEQFQSAVSGMGL